jgi:hypothetical protein
MPTTSSGTAIIGPMAGLRPPVRSARLPVTQPAGRRATQPPHPPHPSPPFPALRRLSQWEGPTTTDAAQVGTTRRTPARALPTLLFRHQLVIEGRRDCCALGDNRDVWGDFRETLGAARGRCRCLSTMVGRQGFPDPHLGSWRSHPRGALRWSCRGQVLVLTPGQCPACDPRMEVQDRRPTFRVGIRQPHVLQRLVQPTVVVGLDEVRDRPQLPRTAVHPFCGSWTS